MFHLLQFFLSQILGCLDTGVWYILYGIWYLKRQRATMMPFIVLCIAR